MSSAPEYPRLARVPLATAGADDPLGPPPAPAELRRKLEQLRGQRKTHQADRARKAQALQEVNDYLAVAPAVEEALKKLSEDLFGKLSDLLQQHLTLALQEVLAQPIKLIVKRDFKRGGMTMDFCIERDGEEEDIMRGQGGSVANVLSVGLRLFALAQLDRDTHRRFLVLDEQDCWLAPDLVPRLVKIVHQAGKALGFQVLMISHHSTSAFAPYAEKLYRLNPTPEGIDVQDVTPHTHHPD